MGDEKQSEELGDVEGGARLDGLILNETEGSGTPDSPDDDSLDDVTGGMTPRPTQG